VRVCVLSLEEKRGHNSSFSESSSCRMTGEKEKRR